jgi:hypothetical protein
MKISETQYYEAKIFLTALTDAHTVLRYFIAEIDKLQKRKQK